MVKILGISGKKQSGKNTAANHIHGLVLTRLKLAKDFRLDDSGNLVILTSDSNGMVDWGEFDVTRKDSDFVNYAEYNIWPHIKMYSFADGLKNLCVEFFGLKPEQVYGTDKQKNQEVSHLRWENMPKAINSTMMKKIVTAPDAKRSFDWKEGPMTAREFMQFFGTDVMRKMHEPVHVNHAIDKILSEKPALSIIPDVRFPNEVKAIQDAGGKVIRLSRSTKQDDHASECGLDQENFDWDNFDCVIHDGPREETLKSVEAAYQTIFSL